MKTSFHRLLNIIFYIREISNKRQSIKSLPVISNTWQLQYRLCAQYHFQKMKVKMFVVWNEFTHKRIEIWYWFVLMIWKIVKSAIGFKTMQLHLLFNIYLRNNHMRGKQELSGVRNYPDCPYTKTFTRIKSVANFDDYRTKLGYPIRY